MAGAQFPTAARPGSGIRTDPREVAEATVAEISDRSAACRRRDRLPDARWRRSAIEVRAFGDTELVVHLNLEVLSKLMATRDL
jgi:hypothetical protein